MKITEKDLDRAVTEAGLPREQSQIIWKHLQTSEVHGSFEPAHVAYFFGALLVIGAMGWFMTRGWDSFEGWQLSALASGYAALFILVGRSLWNQKLFRVPGGLLVTVAVCMTPLAVYGLERQMHLWPSLDPGSYTRFHPYIDASWVVMEIATVLASLVALRFFKFPFLTAPACYALWYMSMDATSLIFGRSWIWQDECLISAIFGAIMLVVAYFLDRKTDVDFAFWGYLFGLMTFTGGLSCMNSGSQLAKFGYCVVHLGLIFVSLVLRRRVFLVFGAFGVFGYLCDEAYGYFKDSVAFPFVLTLIGIGIIFAAMAYKKREPILQARIAGWLERPVI